jgi:hypothetical protein
MAVPLSLEILSNFNAAAWNGGSLDRQITVSARRNACSDSCSAGWFEMIAGKLHLLENQIGRRDRQFERINWPKVSWRYR